ncbi:hypothetical protein WMY93_014881 [Mugilogobius chulae]|uniref:NAD(P)(+)--arginine ADP-ribosyltransferase n=1 Tax=Mugilogobius chulae TaxID=88201 RepID=A0AAW0P7Z0_9GOBI
METTMLALMLCLVLPSFALVSRRPRKFPLDMVPQAVDDMYQGCRTEMIEKVRTKYIPSELQRDGLFKNAWRKTQRCATDKFKTRQNTNLTKNQIHALCIYTANDLEFFKKFNDLVREGAATYTSDAFKYHALHFWLTLAIQNINPNKQCRTTYRRTTVKFIGKVGQTIRFGFFTSTSTRTNIVKYGKDTCFHIRTCLGAPVQEYSPYPNEAEVLVPPYEKFTIVHITRSHYQGLYNCKNTVVLESAGYESNLNCAVAQQQS